MKLIYILIILLLLYLIYYDHSYSSNKEDFNTKIFPGFRSDYNIIGNVTAPTVQLYGTGNTLTSCYAQCSYDPTCSGLVLPNTIRTRINAGIHPDNIIISGEGTCPVTQSSTATSTSTSNDIHYNINNIIPNPNNKITNYPEFNPIQPLKGTQVTNRTPLYKKYKTFDKCLSECSNDVNCGGIEISRTINSEMYNGTDPANIKIKDENCYGISASTLKSIINDTTDNIYTSTISDDSSNVYIKTIPSESGLISSMLTSFADTMNNRQSKYAFYLAIKERGLIPVIIILMLVGAGAGAGLIYYYFYIYRKKKKLDPKNDEEENSENKTEDSE